MLIPDVRGAAKTTWFFALKELQSIHIPQLMGKGSMHPKKLSDTVAAYQGDKAYFLLIIIHACLVTYSSQISYIVQIVQM